MTLPLNLMIADTMPRKVWLTNSEVRCHIEKKYGNQRHDRVTATLKNMMDSPSVRMHREGEYQGFRYMLIDIEAQYLRLSIKKADASELTDWMRALIQPKADIPPGVLMAQFNQLIGEVRMR